LFFDVSILNLSLAATAHSSHQGDTILLIPLKILIKSLTKTLIHVQWIERTDMDFEIDSPCNSKYVWYHTKNYTVVQQIIYHIQ